ncbi:hypothetical protein TVAG_101700 [Trichomonas vaginalis G3]|uniref:Uncharacterized protein n=1 Tax=Trichomonas vaginalis (strain ATCC PRA-98 / G3) TaxID=412133 RepID=A2DJQ2_TRIV3|nr:hypothetical protein TVAGG3_1035130 [Trichomonas vaginalis G3]EAY19452.1 hypothetical protein TVAG_101700 [Trichomonas vaginalis G3]KAI5493141.1 hypothetical protein TVAGG3_1035130 [Trichomonas vaginalis G3]|eukprot:XP_001580438.1 hypothetical protein [Trichomonas vaginalis G3]
MSSPNDEVSDDFVVEDNKENEKEPEKKEDVQPTEGGPLKLNLLSHLGAALESNNPPPPENNEKTEETNQENEKQENPPVKLGIVDALKEKLGDDKETDILSDNEDQQNETPEEKQSKDNITNENKVESEENKDLSLSSVIKNELSNISTESHNSENNEQNNSDEKEKEPEKPVEEVHEEPKEVENEQPQESKDDTKENEPENEKKSSSDSDFEDFDDGKKEENHTSDESKEESEKEKSKSSSSSSSSSDEEENHKEPEKEQPAQEENPGSVLITTQIKDSVQRARDFQAEEEPDDPEINQYSKDLAQSILKDTMLPPLVKAEEVKDKDIVVKDSSSSSDDEKKEETPKAEERDFENKKPEEEQEKKEEEPITHAKDFIIGKLSGGMNQEQPNENENENKEEEKQEEKKEDEHKSSSSSSSDDEKEKEDEEKEKSDKSDHEEKQKSESDKSSSDDEKEDDQKAKGLSLSSTIEYGNDGDNGNEDKEDNNDDEDEVMVTRVKSKQKIPRIQEPVQLYSDQELQQAFAKLKEKKVLPPMEMRPSLIDYGRKMSVQHTMTEEYDAAASDDEAVNVLLNSLKDDKTNTNSEIEKQNIKERIEEVEKQKKIVEEKYKELITRMKEQDKQNLEKLKQQQDDERKKFEEKWSTPEAVIPYSKPSSKLLQLKRMQKAMALNHEFAKAKAFKQQAEEMQKEEAAVGSKQAAEVMKTQYKTLLEQQQRQLECFNEKCERKIRVQESLRDAELASLENARKQLSQRPTNRMKKPRVTIPDVTSRDMRATTPSGLVSTRTRSQYATFKKQPELSKLDVKPLDVPAIIRPLTANSPRKSSRTMI